MITATLFQWVELNQDVPDSLVKKGDKGVVLDHLQPTKNQPEPGYTLEIFKDGETLDVISIPISWVTPLPEVWGQPEQRIKRGETVRQTVKIYYNKEGKTLTVWFDDPSREFIAEEADEELLLMKDKDGKVIGFERLNYSWDTDTLPVEFISV